MNSPHPLQQRPDLPLEQQFELLREYTSRLWDQVWWMSLPFWRRWWYMLHGYRAPLRVAWFRERSAFYLDE